MNVRSTSAPTPGALHVDALPVGTRLGEFEILALLGVGGFGMVYRAFDHSLHRAVAIKEFMPAALVARTDDGSLLARSPADQSAFMAGLKSFVGEARLLAQFDHPSLVKVFRFWEANNTAYMVMPLYTGMTFKQARAQMRTPPPEAWLRKVLWCVLGALRELHDGQTLHRDVSPDNLFLQDIGPPVLLDLGAARHAINDRDHKHTAVLKVNYAPIEQYADGDVDLAQGPWSDLYSLAAVVHGCLCNDTPLPSTLRSIRDRMVPFSRVAKTVFRQFGQEYSPAFVAAISQSLALNPRDRPQSIDAFLQIMEMTTPPDGVEHFDFRSDLGDIWVEPTDQPGPGHVVPTVDVTSEMKEQLRQSSSSGPLAPAAAVAATLSVPVDTAKVCSPVQDAILLPDAADTVFLDAGDTVAMEDIADSRFLDPDPAHGIHAAGVAGRQKPGLEKVHAHSPSQKAAARAAKEAGRTREKTAARPLGMTWLVLAGVFVVVAAAAAYGWRSRAPAPVEAIITELKPPVEASPPLAVQQSVAEPASDPTAAQAAASEPAVIVEPSPAFVATDDPRAVSKSPPRATRTTKVVKEQPAPVSSPAPAPEPAPAPPPEPPAPKPAPRPPAPLCENTNVFTRSMCLREECRKPGNAGRAACVEFRKAMEPLERSNFAN